MIVFADLTAFFGCVRGAAFLIAAAREDAASFFAATFFATATFVRDAFGLSVTFFFADDGFAGFDVLLAAEFLDTTTRTTFFEATDDVARFDDCLVLDIFFKDVPHSGDADKL